MKKLYWMPAMLTAAAMSLTAYAQDDADTLNQDTEAEWEAGQHAGGDESAQSGDYGRDDKADVAGQSEGKADVAGSEGTDQEGKADVAGSEGTDQEGQADLAGTESGDFPDFEVADKDGDGLLGIDEARDALPQHMTLVDSDGDGLLDRDEVEAAMPEVSFTGGNEPVGPNDYQTIQEELQQTGGANTEADQGEQAQPSEEEDVEIDASADLG